MRITTVPRWPPPSLPVGTPAFRSNEEQESPHLRRERDDDRPEPELGDLGDVCEPLAAAPTRLALDAGEGFEVLYHGGPRVPEIAPRSSALVPPRKPSTPRRFTATPAGLTRDQRDHRESTSRHGERLASLEVKDDVADRSVAALTGTAARAG
jgi:hypothetical protein